MTPQEETIILKARDILGRHLSQNPVFISSKALMAAALNGEAAHA
jgi:DNA repair protein RadC